MDGLRKRLKRQFIWTAVLLTVSTVAFMLLRPQAPSPEPQVGLIAPAPGGLPQGDSGTAGRATIEPEPMADWSGELSLRIEHRRRVHKESAFERYWHSLQGWWRNGGNSPGTF